MAKSKKPWQEKLADSKDFPKVVKIPEKMAKRLGKGTLVIPAPKEVDEMRTLKSNGELNEKYPCGTEVQKKILEKEGHTIIQKGKKYIVPDMEKNMARL